MSAAILCDGCHTTVQAGQIFQQQTALYRHVPTPAGWVTVSSSNGSESHYCHECWQKTMGVLVKEAAK